MSLQNIYYLPLVDPRPAGPVHLLLDSHVVPPKQPPAIPRSSTRFHIGQHLLFTNSLIQLLSHQTCHSLRQAHQSLQADGDRNCVTARELSYSQIMSDNTYLNVDRQPAHRCCQSRHLVPLMFTELFAHVLNFDAAARICKVSHHVKFLLIILYFWVFIEDHAHDFNLFMIDLNPSFPNILCEKMCLLLQMIYYCQ